MFKKVVLIFGIITLVFMSIAMTTVASSDSNILAQDQTPVNENVDAKKFKYLIENKVGIILDVRTPGEVENGHIEGAIYIDYYSKSFKAELTKLDRTKPVFVYCKSGGRSGKAMNMMTEMGFLEVYNLEGGYSNWPYK